MTSNMSHSIMIINHQVVSTYLHEYIKIQLIVPWQMHKNTILNDNFAQHILGICKYALGSMPK